MTKIPLNVITVDLIRNFQKETTQYIERTLPYGQLYM